MLFDRFVFARPVIRIFLVIIAAASSSSLTSARRVAPPAVPNGSVAQVPGAYARLPAAFVENRGQIDPRVRYYAQGPRHAFYLTRDEVLLSFVNKPADRELTLALRFPGSIPRRGPVGEDRASGEVNYFHGQDPAGWRTGIPRFSQVRYRELWPGVDMHLRDQAGTLKYEFRVRAGARPADIQLAYAGATGLSMDDVGALLIETGIGTLRDSPPVSYQMIHGRRVPVESRYELMKGTAPAVQYGFAIGAGYRPDHELIIDPGVEYSTFIGGSSHELAVGVKVDAAGNAYVTGTTQSPDFRTTTGAYDRTGAVTNFGDVFVSKVNAAGTALVYSTFIGGGNFDWGRGIAIDAAGNAYVTGQTKSSNFPTTSGAFDRTFNVDTCPRCGIDQYDAFVTKLNAAGSGLVYSTFLRGFDLDDGMAIAVDAAGNAYVAGQTGSLNFPIRPGAFDTTRNAAFDAFISKLNAAGSALVYSTYLGGAAVEYPTRIAVDGGGNAYIVGTTSSQDFPTTAGSYDTTANGAFDVFVTKLNAAGSALVYSTYLGGDGFDSGSGVAVDAGGHAYVSGSAGSVNFPTTQGAFDTVSDGSDGFVTKLNPAGSALLYSTVLGGSSGEGANAIVLDAANNAWVAGITNSVDFPVTAGAVDPSFNGVADAFVSELGADGSTLLYSTYLGGTQSEGGNDIAIDPSGDVYVTGHTYSMDFPTTLGAFDTLFNGDLMIFWGDGFLTKIATDTGTSTPPAPPPIPIAPGLLSPTSNDTPPQPITFDWTDVAGAASYTIQIDTASNFGAPLVREENVSISMYATTGLATTQHFWRVRGVNQVGTAGAWSATRSFTPQQAPPPAQLSTFSTNPETVIGGNPSGGTVVLSVGAPFGGALITLSSSHPAVAMVPATVTAPANSFTASFSFPTSIVATSTTVTITAAYNGTTRTATVTVTPAGAPPPPPGLQTLTFDAVTVAGGSPVQGTVVLQSTAGASGATVLLSSSNAGVASVPATVTVNPGAMFVQFNASTSVVSASTPVTITATSGGTTRTAGFTVTPPQPPEPPAQTATLTVTVTGRSGQRVTSSPAGIDVSTGSTGTAAFASGTSVTLSVTTGRDAIWSGACSSGGNKRRTCTFTFSTAAAVTANVQ